MAISIRNPKAEELAREVAAETGENLTQAIVRALEERLQRLRGRRGARSLTAEIGRISKRCSALPDLDDRTSEEILGYDGKGVPQ